MRFITPPPRHRFTIGGDARMPALVFTTDQSGAHSWQWTAAWRHFSRSGTLTTPGNTIDLAPVLTSLGGQLTVVARAGGQSATTVATIVGTNPNEGQLRAYLNAQVGGPDFLPIVLHEARGRHFNAQGEPIVSFDGGYGMVQLTNPAPTFEQCWNWQRNVDGGLALFAVKRNDAIRYLTQNGRTYTADQLRREAVARWNGGAYHRWDGRAWVRNPDMVCAPGTGNIGWDMTDPDNAGQTVAQLTARDRDRFNRPPRRGTDHYRYSGVCYADRLVP